MQPHGIFYTIDRLDFEAFHERASQEDLSRIKHPYTGGNILHCAILASSFEIAEFIIKNDLTSIFDIDGFGRSPLEAAKQMGATRLYRLILDKSLALESGGQDEVLDID